MYKTPTTEKLYEFLHPFFYHKYGNLFLRERLVTDLRLLSKGRDKIGQLRLLGSSVYYDLDKVDLTKLYHTHWKVKRQVYPNMLGHKDIYGVFHYS